MVSVAGCNSLGLGSGGETAAVDQVPAGVDTVVRVDMAITSDTTTKALLNAGAESVPTGPGQASNVSQATSEFENETGLDPEKADELVTYQKRSESSSLTSAQYAGVIVHGDWETDAVVSAVTDESSTEYEETTYNGQTVYEPVEQPEFGSADWVGILGDGQFVFGTEDAVKDAIDVTTDNGDAFSGDLRSAFDETRDGLITFAASVPQEEIPEQSNGPVDISTYQDVKIVTGVYYTTSNSAGVQFQMHTGSESGATDVSEVTDGAVSFASGTVENETVKNALRSIEIENEGTTVTVTFEDSVDSVEEILRYLYGV